MTGSFASRRGLVEKGRMATVARADDLFAQLFPASASRYWLADRF